MKSDEETFAEIDALLKSSALADGVELDPENDADFDAALRHYGVLRGLEDALSKAKGTIEKRIDELEQSLIPVFERRKIKSIKVVGLGLVGTRTNNNPKVVNTDLLHAWIRACGEEGIIKESVHYMTLKKWLNDRIENGLAIPTADVVELTPRQGLSLTRAK